MVKDAEEVKELNVILLKAYQMRTKSAGSLVIKLYHDAIQKVLAMSPEVLGIFNIEKEEELITVFNDQKLIEQRKEQLNKSTGDTGQELKANCKLKNGTTISMVVFKLTDSTVFLQINDQIRDNQCDQNLNFSSLV